MQTILVVLHILVAFALVGLILIQHGKGADAGAAFGSGASGTVFGAQGAGSFLTRTTAVLAALFFLFSMGLGYFAAQTTVRPDLMKDAPAPVEAPATEVPVFPVDDDFRGEVPVAVPDIEVIEVIEADVPEPAVEPAEDPATQ